MATETECSAGAMGEPIGGRDLQAPGDGLAGVAVDQVLVGGGECREVGGGLLDAALRKGGPAVEREAAEAEHRDEREREQDQDLAGLAALRLPLA